MTELCDIMLSGFFVLIVKLDSVQLGVSVISHTTVAVLLLPELCTYTKEKF